MEAESGDVFVPVLIGIGALALFWRLAAPAIDRRRWPIAADVSAPGLVLAALAILTFWGFLAPLNPLLLVLIVVAVAFHEYGHVLAYRLAGHSAPVFRLMPFGGAAMSDQPVRSHLESAFVSLMGPGFSIALMLAFTLASLLAGERIGALAADAAAGVAFLNLLNMAPFYPLDGGRALRSALTIFGSKASLGAALTLNLAVAALGLYAQLGILMLLGVFGAIALAGERRVEQDVAPMRIGEAALTMATFAVIVATYATVAAPPFKRFMADMEAKRAQAEQMRTPYSEREQAEEPAPLR